MSEKETVQGLNCPNCGGVVPIPEGQVIVRCPYCDMRSFVRGERGLRRYQVPGLAQRQNAINVLREFFKKNWAIARDASSQAQLTESFLVYLPFWTVWGRVAAWAFGEERVGSGDHERYEPREVRIVQEITWNGAACDVGEFGVTQVPLADQDMQPFEPNALHNSGMVFEPVNSFSEARDTAESTFQAVIRKRANLDRLSQLFTRIFRRRFGLVYYPLWVLRYLYHGRAFQVVVDGHSGKILYGKAPGNTIYRAARLVGGMAIGSILAIDLPYLIVSSSSNDSSGSFGFALVLFLAGIGLMYASYRAFRYGEQFEYRSTSAASFQGVLDGMDKPFEMISQVKDVEKWVRQLS